MEYHYISTMKSSEKGDVQLVAGDKGSLYIRRYRSMPDELFQRLRSVRSPYVERLTDIGADGHGRFFVSEFIEGTTAASRSFSQKEAVRVLLELCSALSALHRLGIIHRDIKPSNIICAADGHIRLIDFDSARLEVQYQSRDTELLGTAGYAAPEQYGFMQTDCRADIYAFGVTMRQLLGENADRRKFRHIISRCTELDPDRRYRSIAAVRRALFRAARFDPLPFAAAAVLIAAASAVLFHGSAPSAPHGIVRLTESRTASETEEPFAATEQAPEPASEEAAVSSEITVESAETTRPPDARNELQRLTETVESTVPPETAAPAEPEISSEPETAPETSAETSAPLDTRTAAEGSEPEPEPESDPGSGRTPLVRSDSVNPSKMDFTTVTDPDGLETDVFDYVFYDDPEVVGVWNLYTAVPMDFDFEHMTAQYMNENKETILDFRFGNQLTVYDGGEMRYLQKNTQQETYARWTNGYCITEEQGNSFVCRMFSITMKNGRKILVQEQKGVNVPHRYWIYLKDTVDP